MICKSYTVIFEYTQTDRNKYHLGSGKTHCYTSCLLIAYYYYQSDGLSHRSHFTPGDGENISEWLTGRLCDETDREGTIVAPYLT